MSTVWAVARLVNARPVATLAARDGLSIPRALVRRGSGAMVRTVERTRKET
jgi:hypothetical protein